MFFKLVPEAVVAVASDPLNNVGIVREIAIVDRSVVSKQKTGQIEGRFCFLVIC